jgi:hypothetical protein
MRRRIKMRYRRRQEVMCEVGTRVKTLRAKVNLAIPELKSRIGI